MAPFVGIDFGTTNSAVAVADADGRAELVRFPTAGGTTSTFRSVLYFDPELRGPRGQPLPATGPRAIEAYLDGSGEGRLIQSLKSYLASRTFTATQVLSRQYTLEALVALLVEGLRAEAWRQRPELPTSVVVGRPVRFGGAETEEDDAFAVSRLRAAFEKAGFSRIEFEFEPVAAAHHYERSLDHDELVLIADFGGGTSDFSLMRVGPGQRGVDPRQRILGTAGVALAGDALDSRIVDHVVAPALGQGTRYRSWMDGKVMPVPNWLYSRLRRWHHLSFLKSAETRRFLDELVGQADEPRRIEGLVHLVEQDLGYHLYRAVEGTKRALSAEQQSAFRFHDDPIAIDETVERAAFEGWIAEELASIAGCVDGLLERAAVPRDAVDRVFMTGGSSFVPAVRALFRHRFGEERLTGGDELTSVALGLALCARERG